MGLGGGCLPGDQAAPLKAGVGTQLKRTTVASQPAGSPGSQLCQGRDSEKKALIGQRHSAAPQISQGVEGVQKGSQGRLQVKWH